MSAGAQSLKSLKAPDEVILNKKQAAPFFGVLVPEERYRVYQEQLEVCDIFKDFKHPLPEEECESCFESAVWSSVAFLAIGFATGMYLAAPK